ncbi:unnamed protein product, partial [Nesidiocoris tenuis]
LVTNTSTGKSSPSRTFRIPRIPNGRSRRPSSSFGFPHQNSLKTRTDDTYNVPELRNRARPTGESPSAVKSSRGSRTDVRKEICRAGMPTLAVITSRQGFPAWQDRHFGILWRLLLNSDSFILY